MQPDVVTLMHTLQLHGAAKDVASIAATWAQVTAAWESPSAAAGGRPSAVGTPTEAEVACLYAARIKALSRAGELEAAVEACEEMIQRHAHLLPLDFDLGKADSGGGGVPGERAAASRLRLSPVDYLRGACNAALAAAVRGGRGALLHSLTSAMTRAGVTPDTATYNALLRDAAAHGAGQGTFQVS